MPSPSKYIENKANVLLDLYLELDHIKKSKAFKEGDTKLVRPRTRVVATCLHASLLG